MNELIQRLYNNIIDEKKIKYNKEYSKIYSLHKYWARKPWYIVEKYIEQYSKIGDTVLDMFCGSGVTGLEAVIKDRNFIGYDLNPIAVFVTNNTLSNSFNAAKFEHEFELIKNKVKRDILETYISDKTCENCGEHLYFQHIVMGPSLLEKHQGHLFCDNCNKKTKREKYEITENEFKRIEEISNREITSWYPTINFPEKFYKDRFSYKGILSVDQMFTRRNLRNLAILLETINTLEVDYRDLFIIAFSNTVLHSSKLKGENVRPLGVNSYWIPDDFIEENVWTRFENRVTKVSKSKISLEIRTNDIKEKLHIKKRGSSQVKNKSSLELDNIKVDYIFTDPPYGDAIQYSELSFIWNAWLDKIYNTKEEVIVNPAQGKDEAKFMGLIDCAIKQAYEALKDNCYFTLCFQNKEYYIWKSVIDSCKNAGFELENIEIYDSFGNSFNKNWAKFSPKSDIYVTFKKSKISDNDRYFSTKTSLEDIIVDVTKFLIENSLDLEISKIYDVVVSVIIWNTFYNKMEFDINKFNTKTFGKYLLEFVPEFSLNKN